MRIQGAATPRQGTWPLAQALLVFVPSIGDLFLGGDTDDQHDVPPFLTGQVGRQDVVNQVLPLHAIHTAEALRGDDANDPVLVAEVHLVRGWEGFLQNLLELPNYCHWKTPLSRNFWAALRRS